ncbi:MAG: acyl-CoA dehydrogenase [Gammaproteobacteria bacterium]|jgi:acyl-CoA dehydrogenase
MWDFSTDPDFQQQLDWIDDFVKREVEPLDHLLGSQWNIHDPNFVRLVRPLQTKVRARELWACHLGPHLGGRGYGQLKLALMNELFGRARFGPIVFGSQAPDTGNAEILAHYGTDEQKARFLKPLLENEIVSCFSMTEPHGGADPLVFTTTAIRDGDEWVINGEKWFSSNARFAAFYIVMAVTEPDAAPHRRMSMFIVPADTAGIEIIRDLETYGEPEATHAYLRYSDVRVPAQNILGERGAAFAVAQVRLGGGRLHHAMRTVAQSQRALDMMCERALSRVTKGEPLAAKQMVQEKIADSWAQLRQFRLLVLETAWMIDNQHDERAIRRHIAAVKALMPQVLHDIASRALQIHGSLGLSTEMPFADWVIHSFHVGLADGPTEVHKVTLAREVLRDYEATSALFPDYHALAEQARAAEIYGDLMQS